MPQNIRLHCYSTYAEIKYICIYVHFWKADHFQLMQPDSIAIYRDKTPVIGFVNI